MPCADRRWLQVAEGGFAEWLADWCFMRVRYFLAPRTAMRSGARIYTKAPTTSQTNARSVYWSDSIFSTLVARCTVSRP